MIGVLVINLDAEAARFQAIAAQFDGRDGFAVTRSRGVNGGTLPELACAVLTRAKHYKARVGAGTLGVFLAHVAAWEHAAQADTDLTLVLEDDVRLRNLGLLAEAEVPADADLVFCNSRMEPLPDPARDPSRLEFLDIDAGLRRLVQSGSLAVGMDGYLLRRAGAAKLLAAVETDGFFGHVDWRVLRYSVSDGCIERVIPGTGPADILRRQDRRLKPPFGMLRAYVTAPALAVATGKPSRRVAEDEA